MGEGVRECFVSRRLRWGPEDPVEVHWCMQELANKVILDIGCMKSVVGTKWMNSVVRRWKHEGRWFSVVPEAEVFRFGNGTTLKSRYAVAFEATFAKKHVILRFSVVEGDCPPLLSKPACSQLDLNIDCGKHSLSSPKLKVKAYGLPHAPNGHYLMNIEEFSETTRCPIPKEFVMPAGVEAYVLVDFQSADSVCAQLGSMRSPTEEPRSRSPSLPLPSHGVCEAAEQRECQRDSSALSSLRGTGTRGGSMPRPRGADRGLDGSGRRDAEEPSGHETFAEAPREVSGVLRPDGAHDRGEAVACKEEGQGSRDAHQEGGGEGSHGQLGGLPEPERPLELRSGPKHRRLDARSDDYLRLEALSLVASGQAGRGEERPGGSLAAEPALGGQFADEGGGRSLGTLGCAEATYSEQPGGDPQGMRVDLEEIVPPRRRPQDPGGLEGLVANRPLPPDSHQGGPVADRPLQPDSDQGGYVADRPLRPDSDQDRGVADRPLRPDSDQRGPHADRPLRPDSDQGGGTNQSKQQVVKLGRPNRGMTQKLKAGVQTILANMSEVQRVARMSSKHYVVEVVGERVRESTIFPGELGWQHAPSFEQLYTPTGTVLLKQWISIERPGLIVMRPSGELWLPPNLRVRFHPDLQREDRTAAMKEWYLVREIWKHQTSLGGLMLVDQPFGSEAWELTFLPDLPGWCTLEVDKCAFGRRPEEPRTGPRLPGRAYFGVNNKAFEAQLRKQARCNCPEGHLSDADVHWQALAGQVWSEGLWRYVLTCASAVLVQRQGLATWNGLAEPVPEDEWFVAPVANSQLPEEELRRVLAQIGKTGERYDYVTFEGAAAQLPRNVRTSVAHLHSSLGHPGNDRLVRMLVLSGATEDVLTAARSLRCQVCASVRGPANDPQVSCLKPKMFNAALSGDSFFIFDSEGTKFGVVHYIDGLTDFHVGQCFSQPNSSRAARVLRDSWCGIFGPPDVLRTDGGTEFQGAVSVLNELFGVPHQVIPEGAKYQLGQVERHGGVLKIMMMKMIDALQLKGLEDMRMGVAAALAAKNRLVTGAGVCPMQAVTGRASPLPLSLMNQLCSGKVKYRLNQSLEEDEALQRADRIRLGAQDAIQWIDAQSTLRRAMNAKSRPPNLEMIKEGATVYVYEPPQSRAGQSRRVRDNTSWVGPGTVVCVERDHPTPKRAWVRLKGRVKAVALERLRLATVDELIGATVVTDFVKELEQELAQGRAQVEQPAEPEGGKPSSSSSSSSSSEENLGESIVPGMEWDPEEEKALRRAVASDVPVQILREREKRAIAEKEAQMEPHELDFQKKRRMFDRLQTQLEVPTVLEEAAARGQMEESYSKSRRKVIPKIPSKARGSGAASSRTPPPRSVNATDNASPLWQQLRGEDLDDVFEVYAACEEETEKGAPLKELLGRSQVGLEEVAQAPQMLMGKDRVELHWRKLNPDWRKAFTKPLLEAVQVYIDHDAIAAVPEDRWVPPEKILSSRFVLTNKTKEETDPFKCKLKGRWIIGGHRDSEAGQHATASPTASLLGQNLVNFLAVQFGWGVIYEDVTAAFLQGRPLPPEREVYVRLPRDDNPAEVYDLLRGFVGTGARMDLVRLTKGGFGLPESPRLWYQEYKLTLSDLGLRELRLLPGVFCEMRDRKRLGAIASIHVDDTRYTGDAQAEVIWEKLHQKLKFGKQRRACEGWVKFCGRWEKQDPQSLEIAYKMDDYVKEIPLLPTRRPEDDLPLTEAEKKMISSTVGQLMWAGRQARYDLLYGTSNGQQLAGTGDPLALEALNKVVRRAREDSTLVVRRLDVPMDQWCIISASDAAYGAQPRGASQGGLVILVADQKITQGPARVSILDAQSSKIHRVVRCSMSAELSSGATAFEYGDYVKAVLGEMVLPPFSLKEWKLATMLWRHYLVLDAKTAYDALYSENLPSDRKLLIDIAVLREALSDNEQNFVRWVPGSQMISDGLTKWNGNGILQQVMSTGCWSLKDTAELQKLREAAGAKKKAIMAKAKALREQSLSQ